MKVLVLLVLGVVIAVAHAGAPAAPAAPIKKLKLKHMKEAAYYGERIPKVPVVYGSVEYGDPNPKLTEAKAKRAAKKGTDIHPTIFKASYFSPLPKPHPLVKCFGKGEKTKCYSVDPKTKLVLGKPDRSRPFTLQSGVTGRGVVESYAHHAMEKSGFREPTYDDKLALWKPKKHKRTLVPAPIISFAEIHFEAAAREQQEQEQEQEAADESDE